MLLNKNWYLCLLIFQEKFEWIEEPVDRNIKQGTCDEVSFSCKLSHKGKKAKWYLRNQVKNSMNILKNSPFLLDLTLEILWIFALVLIDSVDLWNLSWTS